MLPSCSFVAQIELAGEENRLRKPRRPYSRLALHGDYHDLPMANRHANFMILLLSGIVDARRLSPWRIGHLFGEA
jgi:hypothetical protein